MQEITLYTMYVRKMSDNNQKHPYHLVDPSPWPLVTSFSALIMATVLFPYA